MKSRAAAEGRTFTSYVEQALRAHLAREASTAPLAPLPTYRPKTPGRLVDLDDRDAVWDALDKTA